MLSNTKNLILWPNRQDPPQIKKPITNIEKPIKAEVFAAIREIFAREIK